MSEFTEKIYLDSNGLTRDSFKLARKIYDSGFRPGVIVGLWRGGTPIAVAVHEFFHYLGVSCYHTALKTQAYTGIGTYTKPVVENIGSVLQHIQPDTPLLIVDDIFDSGVTAEAVKEAFAPFSRNLKFATLYYKPLRSKVALKPDFFLKETDAWLVFPHELMGLTKEEVLQKDADIFRTLFP